MKRRRVLLVVAVAALLGAVAVWQWVAPALAERARQVAEAHLGAALDMPVRIAVLRIEVLPLAVEADGIAIGPDGAAARAARVRARLFVLDSLSERRPVVAAEVDAPAVDLNAFPTSPDTAGEEAPLPPFRLSNVRVTNARVRVPAFEEPVQIEVAGLTGELEAGATGIRLDVSATDLVAMRGGERWAFETLRAAGHETDGMWRIDTLHADGDGVAIAGRVARSDPARFALTADVELSRLAVVIEPLAPFAGRTRVEAELTNDLTDPVIDGRVQIAAFGVRGRTLGEVDARVHLGQARLVLSPARLTGFGGELTVDGDLGLTDAMAYRADVAWTGIDTEQVTRLLGDVALRPLAASGRVQVSGTLDPLAVAARGGGRLAPADGAALDWQLDGEYRDGIGHAAIDAALGGVDRVRADVSLGPREELSGTLRVDIGDTAALRTLLTVDDVPRVTGTLAVDGTLSGTLRKPVFTAGVTGRDVYVLAAVIRRIDGRVVLDLTGLRSEGIDLAIDGGTLTARGRVAFGAEEESDWQLVGAGVPVDTAAAVAAAVAGQTVPVSGGALSLRVAGRGRWSQPAIDGSATAERFFIGRESFARAEATVALAWPRWDGRLMLQHEAKERLEVRAAGTGGDEATIEVRSTPWSLHTWRRAELERMSGTIELSGSLRGPLARLNGTVQATGRELVIRGRRLGALDFDATATAGRWQLVTAVLDGAGRLRATVGTEPGWPYALDGDWSADLGGVLSDEAAFQIETAGIVRADGHLAALVDSNARLEVRALRLTDGPYEVSATGPIVVACRRGSCTLEPFELRGEGTELRGHGRFGVGGIVEVTVDGNGDLRLVEFLGDPIESARGRFALRVDLARSADGEWSVGGQADVADAAFDAGLPVAVTHTDGHFSLAGSAVRIEHLAGRVGGGTFAVGGRVDLDTGPAVTWQFAEVGVPLMPSLEIEATGNGTVQGAWDRYTVAGTVRIDRLLYDRKLELADLLPSFERALADAPRPERPGRQVALDLVVYAPGNLYIENNIAHVEAWADLQITGTAAKPVLNGRIEALEGEVYVRGRAFDIVYAAIDFRPDLGLAAALNINLESTVDTPDASYTVGVRITGTTKDYRVALTSDDPALSQTQIARLVAFGGTGGGNGVSLYDALGYAGRPFASHLGEQAQEFVPLDRVEFEPSFSPTTGSFQPRVRIGKSLTDDLTASVGTTFGVEAQTNAQLDYQLARRTSLYLMWESETATQEGAYGGGMKFRYEFWRVRRFTLLGGMR